MFVVVVIFVGVDVVGIAVVGLEVVGLAVGLVVGSSAVSDVDDRLLEDVLEVVG